MSGPTPKALATRLLRILDKDGDRLWRIDDYLKGNHDDPYLPPNASDEYRLLAKRSVSNWCPLLVGTPAQALYVDNFRRGQDGPSLTGEAPEWRHWQYSRLDARQAAIYRGALAYGHSFALTHKDKRGQVQTRGLSALTTSALFEDPANDETPYAALTVLRWPNDSENSRGSAHMYDGTYRYEVSWKRGPEDVRVGNPKRHGASECPVTRFAASVDLEGRTVGVIEPYIPLQNRINQTVFDLLVAQTYGSFKVRYATGMVPPIRRDSEGNPILDSDGNPQPLPIDHNASRFLFAEDETTRFGSLDETPLSGFIESIELSVRQLAAVTQTPPHYLLGQMANLSADALKAAETSLTRKVTEFQSVFGESWERVFRLAAELDGEPIDSYAGEVVWRDMESRSLAQSADALGKMREQLSIPARGLWARVPGVTKNELEEWERLYEEADSTGQLADAMLRAQPFDTTLL